MFKLLGLAVGLYVAYGLLRGEVYGRSGPGGRLYALLALALLFVL